jgi:hypothetical protein
MTPRHRRAATVNPHGAPPLGVRHRQSFNVSGITKDTHDQIRRVYFAAVDRMDAPEVHAHLCMRWVGCRNSAAISLCRIQLCKPWTTDSTLKHNPI